MGKMKSKVLLAALACMGVATGSSAAVLGTYTLDSTDELAATGVAAGVTIGDMVINDQSEDTNPASGLQDADSYEFTVSGLLINRKHPSNFWFPPVNTLASPLEFTVTAGAGFTVTIDSITATASSPSGHVTALYFGADDSAVGDYSSSGHNHAAGGETKTHTLPSPFVINSGLSNTFHIDINTNALDSDHYITNIQVNGTVVPEPSALALLGLGCLAVARRRRG